MARYIMMSLILAIPFALHAGESNMKILDKAYMNALDKKYKPAIDKTLPLLDSLQLKTIEEIVLAHQVLSLSFCESGNEVKAKEHLKALKAFSPNEDFRAFNPSEKCKKLLSEETKTAKKK